MAIYSVNESGRCGRSAEPFRGIQNAAAIINDTRLAAANGFAVAEEYIDVETAKQTGRTAFGEMVAYLKAHPSVRVVLVEKTDRPYRNLKDRVTVDELDVASGRPKRRWAIATSPARTARRIIAVDPALSPVVARLFD
ncbi:MULTISPECIES: recombinase family protein [unclassified Mesorhizobium]|uniref:recombinase family protein n=1 Tax=unclassified Mesorhizobium TaxID=325217 RepID=UPI00333B8828